MFAFAVSVPRERSLMFTGIIEGVGRLAAREPRGGDARLAIDVGSLPFDGVQLGESIAVNGVCLTVVAFDDARSSRPMPPTKPWR